MSALDVSSRPRVERVSRFPDSRWSALCAILRARQEDPGWITTWNSPTGVRNRIIRVDEAGGTLHLLSDLSRSGEARRITLEMLRRRRGTTSHGVILETLRRLVEDVPDPGWSAPISLRDLIGRCWDEASPWPAGTGTAILVSRRPWAGRAPDRGCEVVCLDVVPQQHRFPERFGALVGDLVGFFGTAGNHPLGPALYLWCERTDTHPLDLQVGWYGGSVPCRACFAFQTWRELRPSFPGDAPAACEEHPASGPPTWEGIAGAAGRCSEEELVWLTDDIDGDPALGRASR